MEFSPSLNAEFIEDQYVIWKSDPQRLSRDWQLFFQGFDLAYVAEAGAAAPPDRKALLFQSRVEELIHRYRDMGHLLSCLDPLAACPTDHPLLNVSAVGFEDEDMARVFSSPTLEHAKAVTLGDLVKMLKETYCRSIGVEYMHLQDPQERAWLQERMEPTFNRPRLDRDTRVRILAKLWHAGLFEQFLHARYLGQKRFSLEGAEVIVPMLDVLLRKAAAHGCREIVLGMSHRGRLNVQANILGKSYEAVMCEFEESYDPDSLVGSGDVKYHQGYFADIELPGLSPVRVVLAPNASHLESVNPIVEGIARARQDQYGTDGTRLVLPVLLHGDAAFAGEGIVSETLNLSQLEGYRTGGTLHIVVNNQIGFTTLPEHARSTRYSTDVAKMLMVPVFHVHGENPEAAVHVIALAHEYRNAFAKDVVVDVVCYRRYGHNEGDEPYYTQPRMYDRIKERPSVFALYGERLREEGLVTPAEIEAIRQGTNQCLELAYAAARETTCQAPSRRFYEEWDDYSGTAPGEPLETGVPEARLVHLAGKMNTRPEGFTVHPRLGRILDRRRESVEKGEGIDWATAEALAFGSLLTEGVPIRFTGQDCRRGTFSQRHAVLVDVETAEHFIPLNALDAGQAPLSIHDSLLAEASVLGFEYGYSLVSPGPLVIWEAQFGDFANNAQCIIDQYIAAGEAKWGRHSGLVLLLPHGMEGQGPEHSSARLERFLQLCAEENLRVCNPTTPAQIFHLLRRQVRNPLRKPLVVMAPKSLLRNPLAVSRPAEMVSGSFREVLDDPEGNESAERILLCSGKIFFDLLEKRRGSDSPGTAVLRLEQLYPFPGQLLLDVLAGYPAARSFAWVQDEAENMGAWRFVQPLLRSLLRTEVGYVGRNASASPAGGYHLIHKTEQESLLERALGG